MKKLLLTLALVAVVSPALAGATDAQVGQTQSQVTDTNSTSNSAANNAGNSQSIIFTAPGQSSVTYGGRTVTEVTGTSKVKNTPSVTGPNLTASNDTCMGSLSGSINVAGFGGSLGSTYKDANCVLLKNARELWNMGMRGAALARMCMDGDNKEAMELTGYECPQTTRERQQAATKAEQTPATK